MEGKVIWNRSLLIKIHGGIENPAENSGVRRNNSSCVFGRACRLRFPRVHRSKQVKRRETKMKS